MAQCPSAAAGAARVRCSSSAATCGPAAPGGATSGARPRAAVGRRRVGGPEALMHYAAANFRASCNQMPAPRYRARRAGYATVDSRLWQSHTCRRVIHAGGLASRHGHGNATEWCEGGQWVDGFHIDGSDTVLRGNNGNSQVSPGFFFPECLGQPPALQA